MCRAGGRRCPNAGGRSTQNTRQAVSRARRTLRDAKQTGNPAGIAAARERLDTARTAHQDAKAHAADHHDHGDQDHAATPHPTAGHDRDVTTARAAHPPAETHTTHRKPEDAMTHDETPDQAGDATTPAQRPSTQDHDDGFNHVGTVHGTIHTRGDVHTYGDTTTTSRGGVRRTSTASSDHTPADPAAPHRPQRPARHRETLDQRRSTITTTGAGRTGDVTDRPTPDTTATFTVRVEGTCPTGHLVFFNLPVNNAVPGSRGYATADTDCPACRQPVHLTGHYTA